MIRKLKQALYKMTHKIEQTNIKEEYDEIYLKELEYGHEVNSNNYKELTEDDYESLASWYEENYKELM